MQHQSAIIVMGVSGSGKTTIGKLLAETLQLPFAEGDDFHSIANIDKMSAGIPLNDVDRYPWLRAIARWISAHPLGCVVSCSALKRRYRDVLTVRPNVVFIHLTASEEQLRQRVTVRADHFMPATLLASQEATLEALETDEPGFVINTSGTPEETVDTILTRLPQR